MTDSPDLVQIASDRLSAAICPLGAELQWLKDADGRDLLWDGDPAFWTGRAPILFPVVGVVRDGVIRVNGRAYPMAKHGFARRRTFALVDQSATAATFRLEADAETLAAYPFRFRLDLRFAIEGAALSIGAELSNPMDRPLPASFGFHPAFRWPLPGSGDRSEHRVMFDQAEAAPNRRIGGDGLLRAAPEPTPVDGRTLALADSLFEDDALIFDRLSSRGLTYGPPSGPSLRVEFPGMPLLGIWTKPGAGFLCIEPWQGIADPTGYGGEYRDKPGVIEVAPGATQVFAIWIVSEAGSF